MPSSNTVFYCKCTMPLIYKICSNILLKTGFSMASIFELIIVFAVVILFVFFGKICVVFAVVILFVFFRKVCGPARVQQVQIVRLAHPLHCWSASPVDKQIPEFHFDNHVHCSPTEMQHDQLQVFVETLQKVQRTRGIEPLNFIFSS